MASESKPQRRQPPPNTLRNQRRGGLFSMDAEQSARVLLYAVVGAVIVAAIAFIAFGYYYSVIRPRHRTVLEADGISVSYAAMKRRVMFEYLQNPTQFTSQEAFETLPIGAYSALLTELTHINRAPVEQGVTADPSEIDAKLRSKLGVSPDAEQGQFAQRLREELERNGLKDSEYRRLTQAEVLQEKVQAKMKAELPTTVQQAKVEVIATGERELAQQAIDRVNAGEAWADVAKDLSADPNVSINNGLIDFTPNGLLASAYNDYAFSGEVGAISAPIEENNAFYVVRVVERQDLPLTDAQRPQYEGYLYNKWVQEAQANMTIVDNWTMDTEAQSATLNPILPLIEDFIIQQQQQQQQSVPTAPAQPIVVPTSAAPVAPEVPPAPEDGQ